MLDFDSRPPLMEHLVRPYMVQKALDSDRKYDIFHPSAWGSCLRKVAYQYYNEKEHFFKKNPLAIDTRMQRVLDNGHGMHARWQNYLDKAGYLRGYWRCVNPHCARTYGTGERLGIFNPSRDAGWVCSCGARALAYEEVLVKSPPEYNFEGHVDAIIDITGSAFCRPSKPSLFVADMKSMKDEYFSELTEAKYEHVVQVNIYMWLLELGAAVVLYENKDTQAIKEMFVPRDESLINRIKAQAIELRQILSLRKLPNRFDGASSSKFPCRNCEFQQLCFA